MDKYEYRVKTEQMLEYAENKSYRKAMEIADTIDWRRIKNTSMLASVSEIYENVGEYRKAKDILFIAYDKAPGSRKTVYHLGLLALKTGDTSEAMDCYEEFVKLAPKDPNQYILRYKILKAQGAPLEQQIEALEEFKHAEYVEKWAYELAKLYHEAGMTEECLEECDDLILWFSEGKYVYQAMELKMKYKPLTPLQQEKYDSRSTGGKSEAVRKKPMFKKPKERPVPDPRISRKIRENVHVTGSIDLPELPEPTGETIEAELASLPDERPQTSRPRTKIESTSNIMTTITGANLADVLKAGVAVASGVDPAEVSGNDDSQVTGQMKIEEILAGWEETQRENARIIEKNQEEIDRKKAKRKKEKEAAGDTKTILADDIRQLMEELESGVEPTVDVDEEGLGDVSEPEDELDFENMGSVVESLQLSDDDDEYESDSEYEDDEEEYEDDAEYEDDEEYEADDAEYEDDEEEYEDDAEYEDDEEEYEDDAEYEDDEEEYEVDDAEYEDDEEEYEDDAEYEDEEEYEDDTEYEDDEEEYEADAEYEDDEEEYEDDDTEYEDDEEEYEVDEAEYEDDEEYEDDDAEYEDDEEEYEADDTEYEDDEEEYEADAEYEDDEEYGADDTEYKGDKEEHEGDAEFEDKEVEVETDSEEQSEDEDDSEYENDIAGISEEESADSVDLETLPPADLEALREAVDAEPENVDLSDFDFGDQLEPEGEDDLDEEEYEDASEEEEYDAEEYEDEYEEEEYDAEEYEDDFEEEEYDAEEYEDEFEEEEYDTEEYEDDFEEEEYDTEEYEDDFEEEEYDAEEYEDEYEEEEYDTEEYEDEYEEEEYDAEEYEDDFEEEEYDEEEYEDDFEEEYEDDEYEDDEEYLDAVTLPEPEPEPKPVRKAKKAKKPAVKKEEVLEIEEPSEEEITARMEKFDTGFVVQGRYDLSATSEIGLRMGLTEEQKKLFSYFVPIRGVSEQIVEILNNDKHCRNRYGTSRTGNIVVIGRKGSGKTVLAVDLVKAIQKQRKLKQGRVAIVTGESLNKKELTGIIDKLQGGALIIEKAAKMNTRTIRELNSLMEEQTGELLFVLEEQRKPLERMFAANPEFKKKFTSRMELPVFINDELVTFGQTYAKENGYRIDEMGILALYSRIDMMQREDHAVTVAEVKEIMDEAIEHSQKANVKHLVKRVFGKSTDESDRIILKEEDFKL